VGTLYLIRHGQASYGQADYDRLSSRGEEQARAVGHWLATKNISALYCGPHRRQIQTAAFARESCPALPAAQELAELAEYPAFEMLQHLVPRLVAEDMKFAALKTTPTPRLLDEAFHVILAKWASDEWVVDGLARVGEFVARVRSGLSLVLAAAASGARIACVTSAGPIGVAVGTTFDLPAARMVRTSIVIRNASISELRFRTQPPEQVSLVTFNTTGHLSEELHSER